MKVYNLGCARDHRFEGWFASAEDYDAQRERGLVECPVCADKDIRRLPSAPRLNLAQAKAAREAAAPVARQAPAPGAPDPRAMQAAWMRLVRQVVANTENVGERFAEEARRMHYDEAPARPIRGVTTPAQAAELAEEGIPVVPLPIPEGMDGPVQ